MTRIIADCSVGLEQRMHLRVPNRKWLKVVAIGCLWMAPVDAADLVRIYDSGRCGYAEQWGETVIPLQFEDCGWSSEGLAAVKVDGKWGYVDGKGRMAIAPRFAAADPFSEGLAFVDLDAKSTAVIDRSGAIRFQAGYYERRGFSEGLAAVKPVTHWRCMKENAIGFDILKAEDRAKCPARNLSPEEHDWGYMDTSGRMVIPLGPNPGWDFHEWLARSRGGYMDRHGKLVIDGKFVESFDFSGGLAAVMKDDKYGFIDRSGRFVVPPTYDDVRPFNEGRGLVESKGKSGFLDTTGKLVIPLQYDHGDYFSEGLAAVRLGDEWGYIDLNGKTVIPFQYDSASPFSGGLAGVSTATGIALIDRTGAVAKRHAPTLMQLYRQLQAYEIDPDDFLGLSPPPDQSVMALYKGQLRALAAATMKRMPANASAHAVEAAVQAELRSAGIREERKKEPRPYGLVSVNALRPQEHPELLAVRFEAGGPNYPDGSLCLFRDREMIFQNSPVGRGVAMPQFAGPLMLLTAQTGHSADGGYGLTVEAYRIGSAVRRIYHKDSGVKLHQIALDPDGFRLETISLGLDSYRLFVYHYLLKGDSMVRVDPLAYDARGFLLEWLNLPWEEAAKWSDPAKLDALRGWHAKQLGRDCCFGGEMGEALVCGAGKTWEVVMQPKRADPVYFTIEQRGKWNFLVREIGRAKRTDCREPGNQPVVSMFPKPLGY